MDIEQIRQTTREFGQGWAYAHTSRVLKLIEIIGVDLPYDQEVMLYAAYLHDWGAFPKYFRAGVDHAQRSRQIAENEVLPFTSLPPIKHVLIAEAIDLHDYRTRAGDLHREPASAGS
jgi:uncharacterized protein